MGWGIAIGTIGSLLGIVLALWFHNKATKLQGKNKLLKKELEEETKEHKETLNQALLDAEQYEDAIERKDERIENYEARLAKWRDRYLASASHDDLHDDANALFERLFDSVSKEENDSEDEGSNSSNTVPSDSGPKPDWIE